MTQDRARKSEVRALAAELGINYTEARRRLLDEQSTSEAPPVAWDGIDPEFGPSLYVAGMSGSGKSVVLADLAARMSESGAQVFLGSPTTSGYLRDLDKVERFAVTANGTLALLESAHAMHKQRNSLRSAGLGFGFPHLYVLIDDYPKFVSELDRDQQETVRKIVWVIGASGRATNVHLVIASQEFPRGSAYLGMSKLLLKPGYFPSMLVASIRPNPSHELPQEIGSGLLIGSHGPERVVRFPEPKRNLVEIVSLREAWPEDRLVTKFRLNDPIPWFRQEGKQTLIVGFSVTERGDELWGGIIRVTDLLSTGKFSETEWSVHDEHLRDIGDSDLPELRAAVDEAISRMSRTVA